VDALPFLALLATLTAPFTETLHAGALDGQVYLRGSTLLVGAPDQPGRPGIELGAQRRDVTMPEDLSDFRVLAERCDRDGTRALTPAVAPAEGRRVVGWAEGDLDGQAPAELVLWEAGERLPGALLPYASLYLVLVRDGVRVAGQALELTAFPCELVLADVDGDALPEAVASWVSAGGSGVTRGASVYELAGGD